MPSLIAAPLVLAIGVCGLSACESAPEPPPPEAWWDDGSGGSKAVALLSKLDAERFNCDALTVSSMDCKFSPSGVSVYVRRTPDRTEDTDLMMVVAFEGMVPGTQLTTATGYLERYVGIAVHRCYQFVSTSRSPEPCELELQGIERGEPWGVSTGAGGGLTETVEVGSRVRIRVSCPEGLYSPGSDDVSMYFLGIVPSEFALEAKDCVIAD